MATPDWRKSGDIASKIEANPWRFDFFQLVHLIEQQGEAAPHSEVGDFTPASKESVKFKTNPLLHFEPAPVKSVTKSEESTELLVNFLGLNGASGVLPFHYSELIIQQLRNNDASLRDFVDIFNHRSVSLFYRAWKKHRPWLKQTSKTQTVSKYQKNWHEELLKGLVGLSTESNASFNRPEGAWLNYAGIGANRVTSPSTLKHAIGHHFGLNVEIREYKGQWEDMPNDVRTRLADRRSNGTNNILGVSALLGQRCWNAQNRFEVEILGIEYEQFMTFAPGSQKLRSLYELIRFKVGTELDFDLSLKIRESHLEAANFSSGSKPQLGWNTRLQSKQPSNEKTDRLIKISVSKHGMRKLN